MLAALTPLTFFRTYTADYAALLSLIVVLAVSEASTPFERFLYTETDQVCVVVVVGLFNAGDHALLKPRALTASLCECLNFPAVTLAGTCAVLSATGTSYYHSILLVCLHLRLEY